MKRPEVPISWFTSTIKRFTLFLTELVFLAICVRLIQLVEPFIFQIIIDRVLPFERQATLVVIVGVLVIVSIFQIAFSLLANFVGLRSANQITLSLGQKIIASLMSKRFSHFRSWDVGENMARLNENETIRKFLVGASTAGLLDLIFSFVYIAVLYALSPELTAIIVISIPFQVLIYFVFGPVLRRALQDRFDANASHQSNLVETISGIDAVKAMAAEEETYTRLEGTLRKRLKSEYRVGILQAINLNFTFAINQVITVAVIYVGANLVFVQELTLGQLIAFHLISARFSELIAKFAKIWEGWQGIRISRRRLADLVMTKGENFNELPLLPNGVRGRVALEAIRFGYSDDKAVLSEFDFAAKEGELVLVTGPSGAGKSTLGRLIAGLETPQSGRVALDGRDISKFDPHSVRRRVVYVPQSPYLFSGSVRANLCLGQEGVEDGDMWRVLKLVGAHRFVSQMQGGLDGSVGERGQSLSGGQRQRIALARALLRDAAVLVLDEPTSSLDAISEQVVIEALEALRGETTLIVITHRPSLFANPDKIVEFTEAADELD